MMFQCEDWPQKRELSRENATPFPQIIIFILRRLFLFWVQDPVLPSLTCVRSEWSRQTWVFPQKKSTQEDLTKTRISGTLLWSFIWASHFRTCLNLIQERTMRSAGSGMPGLCQITFTSIISPVEVKSRYVCLLLLTQNWMLVDGSFIACISLLVLQDQNDSLQRRANSQFTSKQFAWTASASRLTSDREELIAKKENLLVQDYRSRLPVENFPFAETNQ